MLKSLVDFEFITIVETRSFLRKAKNILTDEQLVDLKILLASKPEAGELVQGMGGIRKIRFATSRRGKSGGARVIYFYHSQDIPLFLLDIYTKKQKENLSKAEQNSLTKIITNLKRYDNRRQ